ncbi:MAG TPA: dephospho-CoA kinase [Xanthobacteraceae bacterium]|nr:dephospho-CoA kinase [Xanthobacteraceae bacterium]
MIVLGLTGSVGMGKSATAKMFADEGVPVFDADAVVHRLYEGEAVPLIAAAFPDAVVGGRVDRARLSRAVVGNKEAFARLEAIIHPLVRKARQKFFAAARAKGARVVVVDIPLLFETGGEREVDKIVVVSAPAPVQKRRVLARENMTEEKFGAIVARQMPDSEKRRRADYVIHTSRGFEAARKDVRALLRSLSRRRKGK